jgi:hypothetical protein
MAEYAWGVRETFIAPEYGRFLEQHGEMDFELALEGVYPEWCIVSVDYDAFEMRTWAQCCINMPEVGFSDLAAILNDPKRCPHVEMGARLRGLTVEDAYALKALDKQAYKDLRGLAKGPNFGLPGGMAALRLMDYCRQNYGVEITLEEAENACRVWREIYREAQPYLDAVKGRIGRKYGSKGTIIEFASNAMRGQVGYCDGANGYFQALAAYIAKRAGWLLVEQAYEVKSSPLYGARPLAFVHDEWLYAIRRDRIHEAGHLMAKIMTDTAMEICPDVLFTAAPAAMYRWSKLAGDPVYGADKKLVPYEERLPKAA